MKHRISRRAFLRGCTLLAASAAVGSLTSCGGTNAKDSGLPQLIVGSDTYPPYIYLNNDGIPAGIDVEIATEAFRRMGYAARFEPIDWEQKTNLVESGTIDCIWGCFSMDGREEVYRWAGPYMVSRQVAAVNADSSIRTLGDLAGKTIAVQSTGKPEEIFLSGSHRPLVGCAAPPRASHKRSMCSAPKTAACSMRCWPAAMWMPSLPMRRPSCNT